MKILLALLLATTFALPAAADGIRGVPIFGKWIPDPDGEGHISIGEISELRDIDTNELVGYVFHRDFRSYYIDLNEGQPHIEAWDFPLNCQSLQNPEGKECFDSRLARVTFVPYLGDRFLGELKVSIDQERNLFRATVNGETFLEVEGEGMTITGGVVKEDLQRMPEELVDPAVTCADGITCVRALVFGRLAHDQPRLSDKAQILVRDGRTAHVGSLKVFKPKASLNGSPHRFKTEQDLLVGLGFGL